MLSPLYYPHTIFIGLVIQIYDKLYIV